MVTCELSSALFSVVLAEDMAVLWRTLRSADLHQHKFMLETHTRLSCSAFEEATYLFTFLTCFVLSFAAYHRDWCKCVKCVRNLLSLNFCISQGRVATRLRCDGKCDKFLLDVNFQLWKNFENRLRFVRVRNEYRVARFLTHSVHSHTSVWHCLNTVKHEIFTFN